jgi:hypothetical protein
MSTATIEDRISTLWDRAVDLGRASRFQDMLRAWLQVRRFDEEHGVLDDRERARMHLFLGNGYLVTGSFQSASDEYAQAASIFNRQSPIDESSIQWIEEVLKKWQSALDEARKTGKSVQIDQRLFAAFRETVPSYQASRRVTKTYKISVQARHGSWIIWFEQAEGAWGFVGATFEKAVERVTDELVRILEA